MAEEPVFNFNSQADLEAWLQTQPREVAIAIAARTALRVTPLIGLGVPSHRNVVAGPPSAAIERSHFALLAFAVLQAGALAQFMAKYPTRAGEFRVLPRADKLLESLVHSEAVSLGNVPQFVAECVSGMLHTFGRDFVSFAANAVREAANSASASEPSASRAWDVWESVSRDMACISGGDSVRSLVSRPLWPGGVPPWAAHHWNTLRAALLREHTWQVWIDWYQRRIDGGSDPQEIELIYILVPDYELEKGPAEANAWIKARLQEAIWQSSLSPQEFSEGAEDANSRFDFFLSYNKQDESFARFIDDVLRKAGYRVFAQFRDMPVGSNFVHEMNKGLAAARFAAVLSPRYIASEICMDEWSAAYNGDRGGIKRNIIQFVIETTDLLPLQRQIVHESLVGLSRETAAAAILKAIGHSGSVTPSVDWPGAQALDDMTRKTRGVFDVRPTSDGRLDRYYAASAASTEGAYGFSKEDLYESARHTFAVYDAYLAQPEFDNCGRVLRGTAKPLVASAPENLESCRPLILNQALTAALVAIDQADHAALPSDNLIRHHQAELRGIYERLAAIYPRLVTYREAARKDRQTAPNEQARGFLTALIRETAADEKVATPELVQELRGADEALRAAEERVPVGASEGQRKEIMYEPLKSASAQAIPLWNWLANPLEKFKSVGKSAGEAATSIDNFTRLARQISGAREFFKWLGDWWY